MILENNYKDRIREGKNTLIINSNDASIVEDGNFGVIGIIQNYKLIGDSKNLVIYDKLIGKGAAMLLVDLDLIAVYAKVITKDALKILSNKCNVEYDKLVDNIYNRDRSDLCPIEKLAQNETDSKKLFCELKNFYIERGYLND